MSRLALNLLGPPVLESDGRPVEIGRRKALALLVYLAATEQTHSRDALATLLWPEYGQSQARANLRNALSALHQALGEGMLVTERETVRLASGQELWVDLRQFQSLLEGCPTHARSAAMDCPDCLSMLEQAAALYRNDFLFGFSLPDSREFDEWQFFQTERLRDELASLLQRLAKGCEADGRLDRAIGHARRWLALDPLEEAAQREVMQLYAASGQQAAALRQYRECIRVLQEELGAEPEQETTELGRAIERKKLRPKRERAKEFEAGAAGCRENVDELRLVTVLVAGVSPVVDQAWDERLEDTTGRVASLLEMMDRVLMDHGAHLERSFGDDVLAVFGSPVSHEDDAERAVLASLAIQSKAQELGLSAAAGIDTGMIYANGQTVMGATVNRASRLRYHNQGAQILVSGTTCRRTHGMFEFAPISVQWPGRSEAETVYRVTALKREPEKSYGIDGLRAKLIGREEELCRLQQALGRLLEGQGQIVTLAGEAGVGKSRLIRELRERPLGGASGSTALWLSGRCQELSSASGYAPFLEILRNCFAFSPDEEERSRAQRIALGLQELVGRGVLPSGELEEIGSLLGNLLSVRFGTSWDERLKALGPRQIHQRTFQALSRLFAAIGCTQPTVLVLEDLHWADNLSLDLIALLMETLADHPLLLLCVYRPEREHKCWNLGTIAARKCPDRYTEIMVRELDPGDSRRLAETLLSLESLPLTLEQMILHRGHGNPLFIEEIVRSLIDAGAVVREARGWRWREKGLPQTVPENILVVTQGRIDRLKPEDRLVLQSAAAIGGMFAWRVLEWVVPPGTNLEKALQALEGVALVYEERSFPEHEYAFRHALIQEAVYQSVPQKRRTDLHQRIGLAMEELFADRLEERCEEIAFHFERGGLPEKAVEFLLQAGYKALHQYQNDQAIAYFQRALDLLAESGLSESRKDWKLQAFTGLGRVYFIIQQCEDMERSYSQALELSEAMGGALRDRIRLYYGLGLSLTNLGRDEEAARVAAQGLELLRERTDSEEAVQMNLVLAYSYCRTDSEKSSEISLELARFIDKLEYTEEIGLAQVSIAQACYITRRHEEAQKWYESTRSQAEIHHDLVTLAELYKSTAWYAFLRGDLKKAIEDNLESVNVCRQLGDRAGICLSWLQVGWNYEFLGVLDTALQYNWKVLEQIGQLERYFLVEPVRADTRRNISTSLFCRGATQEGLQYLRQALETYWSSIEEIQMPYLQFVNISLVSKTLLTLGRKAEAREILVKLFEKVPHHIKHHTHHSRVGMALALSGLETSLDDHAAFAAFCREYRNKYPEVEQLPFRQWFLEKAVPQVCGRALITDRFEGALSDEWTWQDPCGDGAYRLAGGLEIRAANGRDLWHLNTSAPRLLRPITGAFAVQALCGTALTGRPAMGGLAIWQDQSNFLHLERGSFSRHELTVKGCFGGEDRVIGRGRLDSEKTFLRLERAGNRVRALCSADGREWYSVGETMIPFNNKIQVGLFGSGWIDRSYYHGSFPEGAAIRFESFRAWRLQDGETRKGKKI